LDEKLDQALYSKHWVPERKKSSSNSIYGNILKETAERHRQWEQFKNANEERIIEQVRSTNFKIEELQ
jgi:hypothetical protein